MLSIEQRLAAALNKHKAGDRASAEREYRKILTEQPAYAEAGLFLGMLLKETQRPAEAIPLLVRAVQSDPGRLAARKALVDALMVTGRGSEAVEHARVVARLLPQDAKAMHVLAGLLLEFMTALEAFPVIVQAIRLAPGSSPILKTLSAILQATGQLDEALRALDRAVEIAPEDAGALIDRGMLLHRLGRADEAAVSYETAFPSRPEDPSLLNNLGACYLSLGRTDEARRLFEEAIRRRPEEPRAISNLGLALWEQNQLDEAIERYQQACALDAGYAEARVNLAGAVGGLSDHRHAIELQREVLRLEPGNTNAHSSILLSMLQTSGISERAIFEKHVEWGRRFADPLSSTWRPIDVDLNRNRRLRIGYVSPDFREHSVRYFIEPALASHDRSRVEVFCYSVSSKRDEVTTRLQSHVKRWRHAVGMTDAKLAEQIRVDRIDVLVDLAGHTAENRLLVFARKPAPVQVTYLGYPATTGVSAIQYRLTDDLADPVDSPSLCTEELVRLPHAFFSFKYDDTLPFDPVLNADRNGYFTFGSVNNFAKLDLKQVQNWAEVLRQVPGSKLMFRTKAMSSAKTTDQIVRAFEDHDVTADRIRFVGFNGAADYYKQLASIDLAFDPFPFNGHTTTCQSIWMGAPVLTLRAKSFRGRVGASILTRLGMADFVVDSEGEYKATAIKLATDLSRLRSLRPVLRDRMRSSPICDAVGFTRSLEDTFKSLWERTVFGSSR